MTFISADRVAETTVTVGTGTLSLAGAKAGFQTFLAGIGNGNKCYYAITDNTSNWEVGIGTVTSGTPNTLSRTTVLASSNTGSLVNFSAGTKDVFCTAPAAKLIEVDDSGNLAVSPGGTVTISPTGALAVNPAAASTINNCSLGVTTPLAVKATTLQATSTVTLSPASANVTISPTGTGTVTISPAGALTINPTTASAMDNVVIGATTPKAITGTTVTANTSVTTPTVGSAASTDLAFTTGAGTARGKFSDTTGIFTSNRGFNVTSGILSAPASGFVVDFASNARIANQDTTSPITFYSNGVGGNPILQLLAAASSTNYVTIAAGANATISTSAGNLAITPAIAAASVGNLFGGSKGALVNGGLGVQSSISDATTTFVGSFGQMGLAIKNFDTTNNNWSSIVFYDAEGTVAAGIGAQTTNHTTHTTSLNFYTNPGSGQTLGLAISPAGAITVPQVGTTASAANAFLDNAASNNLLRSTSSGRYKDNLFDLTLDRARRTLHGLRARSYTSLAAADNHFSTWFGFVAEEAAPVEPRLLHYDAQGRPDGFQYDRLGVFLVPVVVDHDLDITDLKSRVAALEARAA